MNRLAWTLAMMFAIGALSTQDEAVAQSAAPGTALIEGRVTRAGGTPIQGARVTVITIGSPRRTWNVNTGADGAFTIASLPAGRFRVHVHHPLYRLADGDGNIEGVNGGIVALASGQRRRFAVVMMKGGVITGRTTTAEGEPLSDIHVRAYDVTADGALRQASGQAYRSNDIGVYRIANLSPGRYFVAATYRPAAASARDEGYAPTWYPGSSSIADALGVEVKAEGEVSAVDIPLVPTRYVTVEGVVKNPLAQPSVGALVRLAAASGLPSLGSQITTRSDRNGSFRLRNVAPGNYVLEVSWTHSPINRSTLDGPPQPQLQIAMQPVHVLDGHSVVLVGEVYLSAAPRISGELSIDGPMLRQPSLTVVAVPVGVARSLAEPAAMLPPDARGFNLAVQPDTYTLRVRGLPPGWLVERVTRNGSDVTNAGALVGAADSAGWLVHVSRRGSSVSGTVAGANDGTPVLLVNEDARTWKESLHGVHVGSTDADGRFGIQGIRAGRYRIAAVPDFDHSRRYHRSVLQRLIAAGEPIVLAPGEGRIVRLAVTRTSAHN